MVFVCDLALVITDECLEIFQSCINRENVISNGIVFPKTC